METKLEKLKPYVSIVIPMFNAERTIEQCLVSIKALDYPQSKIQTIVVDNLSTDNSENIVKSFGVDCFLKTEGNISQVRNCGTKSALGVIFAFIDSDCLVCSDWLNAAILGLQNEKVGAVGSGYAIPENGTWIEKAWLFEYCGPPFETRFVPGGNLVIKKEVFICVGGFNEKLTTGEDSEICNNIYNHGWSVLNRSDMVNVHLGNSKTIKQFFNKEIWYGLNMLDLLVKDGVDKVFIATVVFVCLEIVTLTSCLFYLSISSTLTIISFCLMVLVLFTSSVYRIFKSKKYSKFMQVFCLYFLYFNARSFSIIKRSLWFLGGYEKVKNQ